MKLIAGGQSGVDRAVLDAAMARRIPYGGWCPMGGWAEDFPQQPGVLVQYPQLRVTPLTAPAQRTEWNVRDAHACMIILDARGLANSPGTALVPDLAQRYGRPLIVVELCKADALARATLWLRAQLNGLGPAMCLLIGGPRESEAPGIYQHAFAFVGALLDAAKECFLPGAASGPGSERSPSADG